jgi:hypothetical protein
MGNPAQGNAAGAAQAPSRLDVVRDLISQKILALAGVVSAPNVDDATSSAAYDEIQLCQAWAAALNAAGGQGLPDPAADQPLLNAIAQVGQLIAVSAAANQLAAATATLIDAYKAPGG